MEALHDRFVSRLLGFFAAALAAAAAGCITIGPGSPAEFSSALRAAMPAGDGEIRLSGPGNWYADTNGHAYYRLGGEREREPRYPAKGVFAVTDTSLVFALWLDDEGKFETVKRIPFAEVEHVALDRLNASGMIVVRARHRKVDSFKLTNRTGDLVDIETMHRAVELVRSRLARKPG